MIIRADFVLIFRIEDHPLATELFKNILSDTSYFKIESNNLILVLHEEYIKNFKSWFSQVLSSVSCMENTVLEDKIEGSIMHLYIGAESFDDKSCLEFTGKQIMHLWKLATVIDLDYGVDFDSSKSLNLENLKD